MSLKISDIGLLLAPTFRSKAILQLFSLLEIPVQFALLLPGEEPNAETLEKSDISLYHSSETLSFDPAKPIAESLTDMKITHTTAPTNDVNAPAFIAFIRDTQPEAYIYSGVAGCILRSDIVRNSGKKFIHAHGGDAPKYSGSTAFYYSILEEGLIGATVFWMDEGLDTGDVIGKLTAAPHPGIEIDRIQDPLIRAEAFAMAIDKITGTSSQPCAQDHSQRVTYHVIHPVLKHIALEKCGLTTKGK